MESGQTNQFDLTRILKDWSKGDASALEQLTSLVYRELHRLASRNLAEERSGHLLQPSALVNEVFLKLMVGKPIEWSDRAHFYGVSARLMRQILIDFARTQNSAKRGGRITHVDLQAIQSEVPGAPPKSVDLLNLDAALNDLAVLDVRQAQVVELRYFGGLNNAEVASFLGISEPTVTRDWRVARAWLFDRLQGYA